MSRSERSALDAPDSQSTYHLCWRCNYRCAHAHTPLTGSLVRCVTEISAPASSQQLSRAPEPHRCSPPKPSFAVILCGVYQRNSGRRILFTMYLEGLSWLAIATVVQLFLVVRTVFTVLRR